MKREEGRKKEQKKEGRKVKVTLRTTFADVVGS